MTIWCAVNTAVQIVESGHLARLSPPRAHVHYVATEYGVSELHGRTLSERARSLIDIAAFQFHEGLERAVYELHLFA